AAAAEIDAELLEHARGPEIGGDDVADRRSVQCFAHGHLPDAQGSEPRPGAAMTAVISGENRSGMAETLEDLLRQTTIFRRLSGEDRQRLAAVAQMRPFDKGALLFNEGDASDELYTVVTGRVKVFKTTSRGTDVILEIFGPGDPVGAVAVYE